MCKYQVALGPFQNARLCRFRVVIFQNSECFKVQITSSSRIRELPQFSKINVYIFSVVALCPFQKAGMCEFRGSSRTFQNARMCRFKGGSRPFLNATMCRFRGGSRPTSDLMYMQVQGSYISKFKMFEFVKIGQLSDPRATSIFQKWMDVQILVQLSAHFRRLECVCSGVALSPFQKARECRFRCGSWI